MSENGKHEEKPITVIYDKDKRLEEVEEKISEILSEAIYSYLIRKKLRGKGLTDDSKSSIIKANG